MTGGDMAAALAWMTSPNSEFGGSTPAEKTKTLEGLSEVVAFLEARLTVLER